MTEITDVKRQAVPQYFVEWSDVADWVTVIDRKTGERWTFSAYQLHAGTVPLRIKNAIFKAKKKYDLGV